MAGRRRDVGKENERSSFVCPHGAFAVFSESDPY